MRVECGCQMLFDTCTVAVCPCKVLSRRGRGISHDLNHGMWKVGRPEEQTNVNCNTRS